MKTRLGILISGTGSNMIAIANACAATDFPAEIAVVISNSKDPKGLAFADKNHIPNFVVDHKEFSSRQNFEIALDQILREHNVELVCLAGFMRILSAHLVAKWQDRLINIHPSLLPLFPGLHTHEQAIAAGMRVHGCTVHKVTQILDDGPILGQGAVAVLTDDTAPSLAARVLSAEHRLYPLVIQRLCRKMQGNKLTPDDSQMPVLLSAL